MMDFRAAQPGFLAALLIGLLRLLVIDIDPPVRDLTDYLAKDECFYVFPAYDLFEKGAAFPEVSPRWYGLPVVTNLFAYTGLMAFGDNYLGLRFGSVLLALACIVLLQLVLERVTRDKWILNLVPLIMVLDLSFGFASILVEPTISRMVMMLLVLWITQRSLAKGQVTIARGTLLLVLAVCFSLPTYPTNAFVVPAVALAVLIKAWQDGTDNRRLFLFACVLAFTAIVTLGLLFGLGTLVGFKDLQALQIANDTYSSRVALSPTGWIRNIQHIPYANIVRLNPVLLLLAAASGLLVFIRPVREWKPVSIVTFLMVVFLCLQTIFINDYPKRKLLIFLPLLLLLIATAQEHARSHSPENSRKGRWRNAVVILIALTAGWQAWMHIKTADHEPAIVMRSLWPGVVVFALVVVLWFLRPKACGTWGVPGWMLALLILPGLINTVNVVVLTRTYAYRDLLVSLRSYGDARFIGAASMGFRPYNNIRTELNPYLVDGAYDRSWQDLERIARADTSVNYCIGYTDQQQDLERIGFEPVDVVVVNPEETWREREFIIYRELRR